MRIVIRAIVLPALLIGSLAACGCRTANVNPPMPRAHTGYVDFYTDTDLGLSWDIKRGVAPGGELHTVFSEFDPVPGSILRLASPPGNHRFQIRFINRAITGPQTVDVQVEDGKVTPVHVTLNPVGTALFSRRTEALRGSATGYGRSTKYVGGVNELFQVEIVAGNPEAYQVQEHMPYWSLGQKPEP
jgi:hypothetical protein